MALNNLAGLKAELVSWLRRSNITVASSVLDTGITLFEAFARRELQAEDMLVEAELITESGFSDVQVPTDFRSVDTLRMSDSPQALALLNRDNLTRLWGTVADRPRNYALGPTNPNTGKKTLRLGPTPDAEYTLLLLYNAKLVGLSTTNGQDSNWLLAYAPDLYFYGTLYHLLNFTRDADGKALVTPDYNTSIQSVHDDQQRLKAAGPGQLMALPTGMTP